MKTSHISFTVIIPTHNRNDLLQQAINSALIQEFKPLEILVIDDINLLSTKKIVEKMNKSSTCSIRYIVNKEKIGAIRSRNIGSKKAKGLYLAFLDDDDYWHEKYLKSVSDVIKKNDVNFIATQYYCFDQNNNITDGKKLPESFLEKDLYLKNPGILCSNVIVEKKVFGLIGMYDEFLLGSCDKDLLIKIKRNDYKYFFLKEKLVFWRVGHKGQWSQDPSRILPSVRRFYIKYFFRMNPLYHLKMISKILKLTCTSLKEYS